MKNVKHTIDRKSSVPLYKQIKDILIAELRSSKNRAGRPFSTEEELIRRFHVSRAPVRQALKELADEGYVYRERGKGTFSVQELPVHPPNQELGGLVRYLREQGMECHSRVLSAERVPASEELQQMLQLNPEDQLLKISRLVYLKKRPIAWSQTFLNVTEAFQPNARELEEAGSVFVLLESELGISIARGDHQISASGASEEEAKHLGLQTGDPILVMETKMYTRNNQLIGWRRVINIGDAYKLSFTVTH